MNSHIDIQEDFLTIYKDLKKTIKNVDNSRRQLQQNLLSKYITDNNKENRESKKSSTPNKSDKMMKLTESQPNSPKSNLNLSPAKPKTSSNYKIIRNKPSPPDTLVDNLDNDERRVSLCIINNEGITYYKFFITYRDSTETT